MEGLKLQKKDVDEENNAFKSCINKNEKYRS